MSCACSAAWKSRNWTANGPTPHDRGCADGEYVGADYDGLIRLARAVEGDELAQAIADALSPWVWDLMGVVEFAKCSGAVTLAVRRLLEP
jgi:hypothetical protein